MSSARLQDLQALLRHLPQDAHGEARPGEGVAEAQGVGKPEEEGELPHLVLEEEAKGL